MKSVMTHDFSRIPATTAPRSTFDRSHGVKTAFDSGYLVPIEIQEVLPGDHVVIDCNLLGRLAPVVTPVMDNVFLDTHWFFCPSRLLWTNFTKMMGERVNPSDSIDYLVPQISSGESGFAVGSLADYFGIPTGVPNLSVNALPFRMYAKVWDDWYRDENLQNSIIQSSSDLGDEAGTIAWNTLLRRGKRHDYFTSCLPSPQKGEGVELPLGDSAPVVTNNQVPKFNAASHLLDRQLRIQGGMDVNQNLMIQNVDRDDLDPNEKLMFGSETGLKTDLSAATAATINTLRMAFQLQRLLEKDQRGGTRFVELIASHFSTICPDARLQRSEYLGGSSVPINFYSVAQTSASTDETPLGNLVSNPKVFSRSHISKAFTEHGYLICLVNCRCDLNYQQGLNRLWSRRGRYDFFWPVLQNLGEQAVLNKEIFAQGSSVKDDDNNVVDDKVFGYQERFAEYRYNPSLITGKLRSTADGTLDVWHLAQKFDSLPTLSPEFIVDTPPLKRILSVEDEPEIILDAYIGQKWTRPMAAYSIPGYIDHL